MSRILILGLGNDILSDDAIGIKLVDRLKNELKLASLEYKTSSSGGIEIVELLANYDRAIIIDAIKTADGNAGDIYHFTREHFQETLHASSFHDVSFLTALNLADKMEIKTPSKIDIIAIEIVEDLVFSNEFSPPIASKYEAIYEEVKQYISKLMVE